MRELFFRHSELEPGSTVLVVEPRVISLDLVLYSLRVIPLYVELFYVQFFTLCTCGPAAVLHIVYTNIFHVSSLSPQIVSIICI